MLPKQSTPPKGRPVIPEMKRLSESFTVRFTAAEYESIKNRCSVLGLSTGPYLRSLILDRIEKIHPKVPPINLTSAHQITGMHQSLTRLVGMAEHRSPLQEHLVAVVDQIYLVMKSVVSELRGGGHS